MCLALFDYIFTKGNLLRIQMVLYLYVYMNQNITKIVQCAISSLFVSGFHNLRHSGMWYSNIILRHVLENYKTEVVVEITDVKENIKYLNSF